MKVKVITAKEAAFMIEDNSTLATDGFIGSAFAEEIASEIEKRFLTTNHPKNLTLIYGAGQGDAKHKGLNHFGFEGMLEKVIGGHWGLVPKIQKLAIENKIKAYNLPQGVMCHMFRDTAAHKPVTITHIGLDTFVDPRYEGGKLNSITKKGIVSLTKIKGKEYLMYETLPIDFAILRGTTADHNGNITMEKEAITAEMLSVAQATKNSNGKVVVQVEKIVENNTLDPKQVIIPGIFVDAIVVASDSSYHMQTFNTEFNSSYIGNELVDNMGTSKNLDTVRKIIGKRAAQELKENQVVNLGIGMPEAVAKVAKESGILDKITLTVEAGPIGGTPASGLDFGCSSNPEAIIDQPYLFDFYQGGGLDIAFLGLAQLDKSGNINVSKLNDKIPGCGGFIDITQTAKKVVFCGTFSAKGLNVEVKNNELNLIREGEIKKIVDQVDQITFSSKYSQKINQEVLYITERAVFKSSQNGLELIEIAPGIDLQKDVIDQLEFNLHISKDLITMDAEIFE